MKNLSWFLPLLVFIIVCGFLFKSLNKSPSTNTPSPLLDKPAPVFNLPELTNTSKTFNERDLLGAVTVVNFWATWCPPCRKEHPVLINIAHDYQIRMLGINYKDSPGSATAWLTELGNPYYVVLSDEHGKTGIEWGIIAVPETFVLDQQGIVLYKHTGPLTLNQWENEIWPIICAIPNNGFAKC